MPCSLRQQLHRTAGLRRGSWSRSYSKIHFTVEIVIGKPRHQYQAACFKRFQRPTTCAIPTLPLSSAGGSFSLNKFVLRQSTCLARFPLVRVSKHLPHSPFVDMQAKKPPKPVHFPSTISAKIEHHSSQMSDGIGPSHFPGSADQVGIQFALMDCAIVGLSTSTNRASISRMTWAALITNSFARSS